MQRKKYLISEIVINIIFIAIIFLVCYFMKAVVWWKTVLVIISILLINMIVGAINIVIHIKK